VQPCPHEAEKWFRLAYSNGDIESAYYLGRLFRDQGKNEFAIKWFTTAANAGWADAEHDLGALYCRTDPPEYEKAAQLFTSACQKGDPDAFHSLGIMYSLGWHFPRDLTKAKHLISISAELGCKHANFSLLKLKFCSLFVANGDPPAPPRTHRFSSPSPSRSPLALLRSPLAIIIAIIIIWKFVF
jgi:TPR repeat protein